MLLTAVPEGTAQPSEGTYMLTGTFIPRDGGSCGLYYTYRPSPLPMLSFRNLAVDDYHSMKAAPGRSSMLCGAYSKIVEVTASGSVKTLAQVPHHSVHDFERDQDGSFFVTTSNSVLRVQGTKLTTVLSDSSPFLPDRWMSICRDKSTGDFVVNDLVKKALLRINRRTLTGSGATGSRHEVNIQFPKSPNKFYCCALSRGLNPGIPVAGGRIISLNPDLLFVLTAAADVPGLTEGFVGTTDSASRAHAAFTLPKDLPEGTCIYVSAVAVNPSRPGGLDIANTDMVKADRPKIIIRPF